MVSSPGDALIPVLMTAVGMQFATASNTDLERSSLSRPGFVIQLEEARHQWKRGTQRSETGQPESPYSFHAAGAT
jgi:hypothetical protein